jgi:hypothetical protein
MKIEIDLSFLDQLPHGLLITLPIWGWYMVAAMVLRSRARKRGWDVNYYINILVLSPFILLMPAFYVSWFLFWAATIGLVVPPPWNPGKKIV